MAHCFICGKKVSQYGGRVTMHMRRIDPEYPHWYVECETVGMSWESMLRQIELIKFVGKPYSDKKPPEPRR